MKTFQQEKNGRISGVTEKTFGRDVNPPRFTVQGQATATGNTSITVTATATDDVQTTLYYTLRYSTSQSSLDTTTTTKTAQAQKNQQVTFNLTASDGISNYTTYYFRIDVSDGFVTEITKGNVVQATTWCNLGTYCSGKVKSYIKCGLCNRKWLYRSRL